MIALAQASNDVDLVQSTFRRVLNCHLPDGLTPRQAEDLWAERGIATPYSKHEAEERGPVWSLPLALAYIACRDVHRAPAVRARMAFWAVIPGEVLQHDPCQAGHVASLYEAAGLLHRALLGGLLVASGVPHEAAYQPAVVPSLAWASIVVGLGDNLGSSTAIVQGLRYLAAPAWTEVRVRAADVLDLWPPQSTQPDFVASEPVGRVAFEPDPIASDLVKPVLRVMPGRGRPSKHDRHVATGLQLMKKGVDLLAKNKLEGSELITRTNGMKCSATAFLAVRKSLMAVQKSD